MRTNTEYSWNRSLYLMFLKKNATVIQQPGLPYAKDHSFNIWYQLCECELPQVLVLYVQYGTIPDQGDDKSWVSELLPVDTENDIARQKNHAQNNSLK